MLKYNAKIMDNMDMAFQNLTVDKKHNSAFFEKILDASIKELNFNDKGKSIEVSVNLVDKEKIKQLNKKYRHKNKVTDVLSFPMQSYRLHRPEGAKRLEGPPFDLAQSKSKVEIFDLGDIFICLPFAKKQAKMENIDIE